MSIRATFIVCTSDVSSQLSEMILCSMTFVTRTGSFDVEAHVQQHAEIFSAQRDLRPCDTTPRSCNVTHSPLSSTQSYILHHHIPHYRHAASVLVPADVAATESGGYCIPCSVNEFHLRQLLCSPCNNLVGGGVQHNDLPVSAQGGNIWWLGILTSGTVWPTRQTRGGEHVLDRAGVCALSQSQCTVEVVDK